jgi:hypothetical protein
MSPHGINLPVGGTDTLTVTPVNYAGTALTTITKPSLRFRLAVAVDSLLVHVDSLTGVVTGIKAGRTSGIVARLIDSTSPPYWAHADTTALTVYTGSTAVAGLTLQPATGDSLLLAVLASRTLAARDPVSGTSYAALTPVLGADYTSSDKTIASINRFTGAVTAVRPGSVTIRSKGYVNGHQYADSVVLTTTYPIAATVTMTAPSPPQSTTEYPFPGTLDVEHHAVVTFRNSTNSNNSIHPTGVAFDVTFANASAVTGGNITGLAPGASVTRTFPTPGTYTYTGTGGVSGTIVVHASPQ